MLRRCAEIVHARRSNKSWFAKCDESPELFLAQVASILIAGSAPITWRKASNWGAVPLHAEILKEWAADGALNSVASIRLWRHQGRAAGMASWEMGQSIYADWLEKLDTSIVTDGLEDVDIADIVEAALALHLVTEEGHDLSCLGDTEVFANWLVNDLTKE